MGEDLPCIPSLSSSPSPNQPPRGEEVGSGALHTFYSAVLFLPKTQKPWSQLAMIETFETMSQMSSFLLFLSGICLDWQTYHVLVPVDSCSL